MDGLRITSWHHGSSLAKRALPAFAAPVLVTLLAIPDNHPPTAVVVALYMLGVVIAARFGGAWAGIAVSLLSFLSLNFFFTQPLHTFVVGAPEDLVALVVFLVASVVVGVLFSSALHAKSNAERRELEARLLNRLATRLLSGEPAENVLSGFADGICDLFDLARCDIITTFTAPAAVARRDMDGKPEVIQLAARGHDIGEIRIWTEPRRRLGADDHEVVRSLATQLALALEGMRLSVEVRNAELEAHASELKAALFSGVTHDVKTPLAAIMTAATSLSDGLGFTVEQRRQHVDTIRQEAERLHRVVNNLLDVARLRAGALEPVKVPSPIDELMESVLQRLRPLLDDRHVEIRVGEDVPEVPMDVVQIDQVMTNLIENAIKFTPAGSPLALSAVGSQEVVRVTIADRGPGIPKEDRVRIFEPFERGGASASGTGLGLAISNAIVVAHGGRMWVSDNAPGGAAFTFELPCRADAPSREVTDAGARTGR